MTGTASYRQENISVSCAPSPPSHSTYVPSFVDITTAAVTTLVAACDIEEPLMFASDIRRQGLLPVVSCDGLDELVGHIRRAGVGPSFSFLFQWLLVGGHQQWQ